MQHENWMIYSLEELESFIQQDYALQHYSQFQAYTKLEGHNHKLTNTMFGKVEQN